MTPPRPTSILGSSQHMRANRHMHLLCSGCESLCVAGLRGWLRKPGRCWRAKDHPATYTGWRPAPLHAGPHPWAHLHIGHTPASLWRFPFPNTQTTTSNSCSICMIYDFSNHTFVSLEFYRHSQGLLLQDSLQWEVAMLVFRLPGVETSCLLKCLSPTIVHKWWQGCFFMLYPVQNPMPCVHWLFIVDGMRFTYNDLKKLVSHTQCVRRK